jgi:hypothetical protein
MLDEPDEGDAASSPPRPELARPRHGDEEGRAIKVTVWWDFVMCRLQPRPLRPPSRSTPSATSPFSAETSRMRLPTPESPSRTPRPVAFSLPPPPCVRPHFDRDSPSPIYNLFLLLKLESMLDACTPCRRNYLICWSMLTRFGASDCYTRLFCWRITTPVVHARFIRCIYA